ncbi:MAG: 50S ribosomal protein L11 methyltransferase [Proteobacteria bacterium]|jgi:ribosomal protein L11 methyltransferase|nr:50S ribosomal protein L11 methyltransferase [Desulfocapsa sp.]MBU3944408.1 50S ribosomal protein L11 methyltransferase [Pseudomonadota bacterium]MCG2742638.1 50S ribosomal protein L11 methyltransferase [Desulfobacteraceae bacterium]MBU3983357.1 50S ribosomal protein L11 methyltransferase [Pseudomonadota bacterium]MBU4028539.1 50S ribosomal protein L11 methyltransferase [Pseudomonadota bacterium]
MTLEQDQGRKWLKISITTDPVLIDAIEDFMVGITDAGVELSVDQPGNKALLNAYFDKGQEDQPETDITLSQLSSYLLDLADIFEVAVPTVETSFIEDEDWSKTWKEHFKPFAIIPGLIIAPTWEPYEPLENEQVIVMDPGMAFGTGHHATTSLSLQLLHEALKGKSNSSVLDVGTGTGILGMAAALFGASKVMAIDNDPLAVTATKENIARNQLQQIMEVAITPLAALTTPYSLVIANIVHDVLLELAPDLGRLTENGGQLLLSGILHGLQVTNIISCFEKLGFSLKRQEEKKEWAAILFSKG